MANTQLQDNFKIAFKVFEFDADNNPASPTSGDTCTVTSSDTASVSVVQDSTPTDPNAVATGFLVGGAKLGTGITISAPVVHADGTPQSNPTLLIDVVAGEAVSAGITLDTPVPQ